MKPSRLVLLGAAAGGLVIGMLLTGASAQSILLPLLVIACPLMMLFMGHGGAHSHADGHATPPHPTGDEAPVEGGGESDRPDEARRAREGRRAVDRAVDRKEGRWTLG